MIARTRVVIADDHPVFRRGLTDVIAAEADLAVVGEAGEGSAALEAVRREAPDVVVLDVRMPGLSGLDVAEAMVREALATRVLFLTMHDQPAVFERAMSLGAAGYVLKDAALSEIVAAVRAAGQGRTFVSPALSEMLVARAFPGRLVTAEPAASTPLARLGPRERQILRLIAASRTSKEIAADLGLHYRTVDNQRTAISQKLGLQGTHALVKFAFDHRDEL